MYAILSVSTYRGSLSGRGNSPLVEREKPPNDLWTLPVYTANKLFQQMVPLVCYAVPWVTGRHQKVGYDLVG